MAACTVLRGSLSSFLCRKAGYLCLLWTPHGRGLSFPMGGPSYLPLGCDPDGYAAVVPPARDTQRGVVGPPHLGGGVVEHVVNHPMVLNVFAWEGKQRAGHVCVCGASLGKACEPTVA